MGARSSLAKAEVVSRKCGVNSIHVFLNHHYQSLEILSLNCVGRVLWLVILCNHTCLICHEGGTIIHPNRHYAYIYPIRRHQLQDELVRHCKPNIKSQHVYWFEILVILGSPDGGKLSGKHWWAKNYKFSL